jgi:hypothetical protein
MKKLLLIALLLGFTSLQAQTLNDVFSKYVQPRSTTEQLREGIKLIDELCATAPEDKCSKAKASAYYLLANRYYEAATSMYDVDPELVPVILEKANENYNLANSIFPITEFNESQQTTLLDQKRKLEANPRYKASKS